MTNWENKTKWILITSLVLLAGAYIYFLNNSIFSVAERRDNEEKIAQLDAEVSVLEANYLGVMSTINLELVKKLGYVDAGGNASFATLNQPLGLLATNNEI